ncbi:hypothetical protein CF65_02750 [Aggregatibacter actinomycetemcomitans HK1651]|nr:hypothetical protein CF65_02750 [Aggregatibacter actinomycetemcomitans HK1651]
MVNRVIFYAYFLGVNSWFLIIMVSLKLKAAYIKYAV